MPRFHRLSKTQKCKMVIPSQPHTLSWTLETRYPQSGNTISLVTARQVKPPLTTTATRLSFSSSLDPAPTPGWALPPPRHAPLIHNCYVIPLAPMQP
jgi:hypothetical protein